MEYGVETVEVTNDIAFAASALRAAHGSRHFPILDALVVAAGINRNAGVITTDDKWPTISDVEVTVLNPNRR